MKRRLIHPLQSAVLWTVYGIFRAMPLDRASALGGWLGRRIGPRLTANRRAIDNLEHAFPRKSASEITAIARAMWDHLGRMFGEYAHLEEIGDFGGAGRVEVRGGEILDAARQSGKPVIFFSGHIGNWEVCPMVAREKGFSALWFYRAANNPGVERLLHRVRRPLGGEMLPKGATGARQAITRLRGNGTLGLLADQKMNDGISIPFFGRPAMTAPALAQLALRFDCTVIAARVERLDGANFRITIQPPLKLENSGNRQEDIRRAMTGINQLLEGWIRERPEQWLWPHRRWPD